ncbi:MAG: peptidase M23 [Candidatus Marinimicrobia bacterium]|nr:peptidase M23 [Candidatus Neomarinimicrobiota bacterium]|tara:strand:- start:23189 stop:24109 length:921 start_codon:yes stop_codon:yes gene_type:complete
MFKKMKDYKIILLKKNNLSVREFNIFTLFLFGAILFIFISISIYSTEVKDMLSFYDLRRNQKNNRILEQQIKAQQNKIDVLLEEINSLKERDESMRKLLKIPSINDDVRKLGVGGSDSIRSLNDLNYLLPNKFDLDKLPRDLAFIERSINLEKLSYNQIESIANEKLDYYLHYPAIYPVSLKEARRTSRYGYRRDPFTKSRRFHEGDDFSGPIGVDVYATADGKVVSSKRYGSFGNYIEINHGNGYMTVYAHLSTREVRRGDKVERGQKIGEIGNTGRSTAPHLHYEVIYNDKHTNPNKYYFKVKS